MPENTTSLRRPQFDEGMTISKLAIALLVGMLCWTVFIVFVVAVILP